MLLIERSDFDTEFPEEFNWSRQTSTKIESAARIIVEAIRQDFKTESRHLVPGLRTALNAMAACTEFYEG